MSVRLPGGGARVTAQPSIVEPAVSYILAVQHVLHLLLDISRHDPFFLGQVPDLSVQGIYRVRQDLARFCEENAYDNRFVVSL